MKRLAALALAAAQLSAQDEKATFEKVCGACHAATMVSDLKTEPEWVETVDHMIDLGAKGTRADFEAVLRYLARNQTKVNVNTATAEQLATVLDITADVAEAIVTWRSKNGRLKSLDDLKKVPSLDQAKLKARSPRLAIR